MRSIMSQEDAAMPGKQSLRECLERLSGIADRLLDVCIELALSGERVSEAFDLCKFDASHLSVCHGLASQLVASVVVSEHVGRPWRRVSSPQVS